MKVTKLSFQTVADPSSLISTLKERLPHSCFMLNQVQIYDHFKDHLTFYILGDEISSDTWIVSKFIREDYGMNIIISAPLEVVEEKVAISAEIKNSFATWNVPDWKTGFVFTALTPPVAKMMTEVSTHGKFCVTEIAPCRLYYMDIEDALNLQISDLPSGELRRLCPDDADFIVSGWKYRKENSEKVVRKCIEGIASGGVFVDNQCASGVVTLGVGLQSMLFTRPEYRNRGYAKLAMLYAFREVAKEGLIPASTVELGNERSIVFHESLGSLKRGGVVDWIFSKGPSHG